MESFGKLLTGLGLALVFLGLVLWLLGRAGFRGLPGDISYESERVRVYFPIVSSLVLSVLLSIAISLWIWLNKR